MTLLQRAAATVLGVSTLAGAAIAALTWSRLFDGTPDGAGRLAAATCSGASACSVTTLELSPGRYRAQTGADDALVMTLDFDLKPEAPARVVLLPARSDELAVTARRQRPGTAEWEEIGAGRAGGGFRRGLLTLRDPASGRVRVVVRRSESGPGPLLLEEIGVFASDNALLGDPRPFLRGLPDRRVYSGVLARVCLALAGLGLVATLGLPSAAARRGAIAFGFLLTLAATTLELWLAYNPYWLNARDLAVSLASGPLQESIGSNLNYGMHLGSRLLQGEGLTFGPGRVPWERTPGYGFFGALAGLVAGYRTDLLTIGLYSIRLHLLALAAANAAFVSAASRVMRPAVALAAALVVAFMPNQIANTQADSVMVPLYLLSAAALCRWLARVRGGSPPRALDHLLVHGAFALWVLMRPDGVIGWAAVSLLLYWRRWRWLALPAALYLAIGLSWGAYKYRYTGEFSMTTNTVGDNAWIGLWQVPNKFRWQTKDESYFTWAREAGVPATSQLASQTALRQVARFAATYPVYCGHLVLHRLLAFIDLNVFNGRLAFPHVDYERLRGPAVFGLVVVVTLALLLGHERQRTLFLAWPLFFNLPLFLVFFSDDMRHVAPVSASLLVASLPLLTEAGFYATAWRRRGGAVALATGLLVAWLGARQLDQVLLASDAWRYWTPFLDPAPFAWYLR